MDSELTPPVTRFEPWRHVPGYEAAVVPGCLTETIEHLAGQCEAVNQILGIPLLPLDDQPNLATHGIFEVPSTLLQEKREWSGDDLPPQEVSTERVWIWGDGSCVNSEHFFSRTIGFSIVDHNGELIYRYGQRDPLASSYKAELFALVAAVRTRGPLLHFIPDCHSLKETFAYIRFSGFVPQNLAFASWWQGIFDATGFGDACLLEVQWIKAHQFDNGRDPVDVLFLYNKRADFFAKEIATNVSPIPNWMIKALKQLVMPQKDLQTQQNACPDDDVLDENSEQDDNQLQIRFCKWEWNTPLEQCMWCATNEDDPPHPRNWKF
eukprot:Skav211017  [mRNA]  locus=scaffold3881:39267:40313:+ [translate_table: standard]